MPLLWLSLAFLAGILLAAQFTLPTWVWLTLAGCALGIGLLSRFAPWRWSGRQAPLPPGSPPLAPVKLPLPLYLITLALFLGATRYQSAQPDLSDPEFIASYNDREIEQVVEGLLVEPPDPRDTYTNVRLQVERIRASQEEAFAPVNGLLLARVPPDRLWHYGDRVRLEGRLETPPEGEDFSYRDYLARQGVYSYLWTWKADLIQPGQGNWFLTTIYALKERALATIYHLYPDPEASLLAGILLGVESGIPEVVQRAFQDTGTSHIIAISGFNITILAALFATLFGRFLGRWRGAVAAMLAVAIYTVLVGAEAPAELDCN